MVKSGKEARERVRTSAFFAETSGMYLLRKFLTDDTFVQPVERTFTPVP